MEELPSLADISNMVPGTDPCTRFCIAPAKAARSSVLNPSPGALPVDFRNTANQVTAADDAALMNAPKPCTEERPAKRLRSSHPSRDPLGQCKDAEEHCQLVEELPPLDSQLALHPEQQEQAYARGDQLQDKFEQQYQQQVSPSKQHSVPRQPSLMHPPHLSSGCVSGSTPAPGASQQVADNGSNNRQYASQLAAAVAAATAQGDSRMQQLLQHPCAKQQQTSARVGPRARTRQLPTQERQQQQQHTFSNASVLEEGCVLARSGDDSQAHADESSQDDPASPKSAVSQQQQRCLPSFAPFIVPPADKHKQPPMQQQQRLQQRQRLALQLKRFMAGKFDDQAAMLLEIATDMDVDVDPIPFIRLDQFNSTPLATGGFGQVHFGKWDGKDVVAKVPLNDIELEMIVKEALEHMRLQQCGEVVRFYGIALMHGLGSKLPALVFEYMAGGTVSDRLKRYKQRTISSNKVPFDKFHLSKNDLIFGLSFALNSARALHKVHQCGMLHLDVKSDNFLVSAMPRNITLKQLLNHRVVIADLGLAKWRNPATSGVTADFRGTLHWMAPEVLASNNSLMALQWGGITRFEMFQRCKRKLTVATDVYSLGIVIWEDMVLEAYHPYEHIDEVQRSSNRILQRIAAAENPERPKRPSYCPDALWQLLEACWDPEPANRPSLDKVITCLDTIIHELLLQAVGAHAQAGQAAK